MHYDVIIIGTGAGGGTLAYTLAPSGQADPAARARRLRAAREGQLEHAGGQRRGAGTTRRRRGATGTASRSTRTPTTTSAATPSSTARRCSGCGSEDFGEIRHHGGVSPAWPITLRRARAVLHRRPSTSTRCTASAAWTRPSRRRARRTRIPAVQPRAAHPAAARRLGAARPAPVPRAARRSCSTRRTRARAAASAATPATAIPCLVHAKSDAQVCLRRSGARSIRT